MICTLSQQTFLEYLLQANDQARCWDKKSCQTLLSALMKLRDEESGKAFREGTFKQGLVG